jgi:hypothetical protein
LFLNYLHFFFSSIINKIIELIRVLPTIFPSNLKRIIK